MQTWRSPWRSIACRPKAVMAQAPQRDRGRTTPPACHRSKTIMGVANASPVALRSGPVHSGETDNGRTYCRMPDSWGDGNWSMWTLALALALEHTIAVATTDSTARLATAIGAPPVHPFTLFLEPTPCCHLPCQGEAPTNIEHHVARTHTKGCKKKEKWEKT